MKQIGEWFVGKTQRGFTQAFRQGSGCCTVVTRNEEGVMISEWSCSPADFRELVKNGYADGLTSITALSYMQLPCELVEALTEKAVPA